MDLSNLISELKKMNTINMIFQNKIGEIIILLNKTIIPNKINDSIHQLLHIIQNYLCHNYYLDFCSNIMSKETTLRGENKNNTTKSEISYNNKASSKTYDNSMSLILIILAKFCKIDSTFAHAIIEIFLEHISVHLECFNYVVSFYRLYNTCIELKYVAKEYELYNKLFEIYKKVYDISYKFEIINFDKNTKIILPFDKTNDSKYLLVNMKRNEGDNELGVLREIKETVETIETKDGAWPSQSNSKPHSTVKNSFQKQQSVANKVNDINSKMIGVGSIHEKKYSTSSYNLLPSKCGDLNLKLTESKPVPTLKLPKNIIEQHFSLTR